MYSFFLISLFFIPFISLIPDIALAPILIILGCLMIQSLKNIDFDEKSAIIFGNEGNGLTQELIDICDKKIKIPMNSNAESLNVSVACGILIWEMTKKELLNE